MGTTERIIRTANEKIGSLSTPSKMPGYSWSIPAKYCVTGSKLAVIEGTPCSKCYALRGRYRFPSVENAQEQRLHYWATAHDWVQWMSARLLQLSYKHEFFRWFDSGDLQNVSMLQDIIKVCGHTQDFVKHWLPTQERGIVRQCADDIPDNLCIRVSSTKLNEVQHSTIVGVPTSSISNEQWTCPSSQQGDRCGDCRDCWNKSQRHITYRIH